MTLPDYPARLQKSEKFLEWRPKLIDRKPSDGNRFAFAKPQVAEKHVRRTEMRHL